MEALNKDRNWIVGDVFTTNFWDVIEVCLILSMTDGYVCFIRLESIRRLDTIKNDYCSACLEDKWFGRINKTFLHHSEWYSGRAGGGKKG